MNRPSVSRASLFALLAVGLAGVPAVDAQTYPSMGAHPRDLPETSGVRVTRLLVEPGASMSTTGDQVLVYLTADPDGRLAPEAVWRPADAAAAQNRGPRRVEALAIELKDVAATGARSTPPEALADEHGVTVTTLIDNPRVLVLKRRYTPNSLGAPFHFHGGDVIVVYLRGGYTWPLDGSPGAVRVRQGDVDLVPANTIHTLANAGADPLEMLVVIPR